jgi:hypothetical protein
MMKKFIYLCVGILSLTSCELDDYPEPSETFCGQFLDKTTGEKIQTESGSGGIQIYMYETSYKENPTPWNFTAMQNGTFQNTKVFAATYTVVPYGPFVPLTETDASGNYTKDERLKEFKISGTTTHNFEVEPFLRLKIVGNPSVKDNKISVTVRIERGTENTKYQQDCTDVVLFVNNSSTYVGNNNYDSRVSTFISGNNAKNAVGKEITITSDDVTKANGTGQNYYVRVGARIDYATNGVRRYNYTEPLTVAVP